MHLLVFLVLCVPVFFWLYMALSAFFCLCAKSRSGLPELIITFPWSTMQPSTVPALQNRHREMEGHLSKWLLIFSGLSVIYHALQQGIICIKMVSEYVTSFILWMLRIKGRSWNTRNLHADRCFLRVTIMSIFLSIPMIDTIIATPVQCNNISAIWITFVKLKIVCFVETVRQNMVE